MGNRPLSKFVGTLQPNRDPGRVTKPEIHKQWAQPCSITCKDKLASSGSNEIKKKFLLYWLETCLLILSSFSHQPIHLTGTTFTMPYDLVALGNPLLDIQVNVYVATVLPLKCNC